MPQTPAPRRPSPRPARSTSTGAGPVGRGVRPGPGRWVHGLRLRGQLTLPRTRSGRTSTGPAGSRSHPGDRALQSTMSSRPRRVGVCQLSVQVTLLPGTGPLAVGEANSQLTVSTTVPGGCSTVIVAEVNARSSISSVQLVLGQPGAPGITGSGATVTTENGVLPFLISA